MATLRTSSESKRFSDVIRFGLSARNSIFAKNTSCIRPFCNEVKDEFYVEEITDLTVQPVVEGHVFPGQHQMGAEKPSRVTSVLEGIEGDPCFTTRSGGLLSVGAVGGDHAS